MAQVKKRRAIFDFHRQNSDILILQETHSTPDCEEIWENEWGGKAIFSHGTSLARGVAILTSKEIYSIMSNIYIDLEGRYIIVDVMENDTKITLVALYAPNTDDPLFFQQIAKLLRDREEKKILIGDYNLTLDVEMDRLNTYCNNSRSLQEVENMMEEFCLRDIWRDRNPNERQYSWIKNTVRGQDRKASRIDFALISGGLDQMTEMVLHISSVMTDHRAVYMVIETIENTRGTGCWKFNNMLLQNQEYIEYINKEIESCLQIGGEEPISDWEKLKQRVKKATIAFSRNKTREDKIVISQLSEAVNQYEENLPLPEEQDNLYQNTKKELDEKVLERIAGVMFRSKAKWYEQGERNTKYFLLTRERQSTMRKTCYKILITEDESRDNLQA